MTDTSRIPTLGRPQIAQAMPEQLYQEMQRRNLAPILGDAMMLSVTTTTALVQQARAVLRDGFSLAVYSGGSGK